VRVHCRQDTLRRSQGCATWLRVLVPTSKLWLWATFTTALSTSRLSVDCVFITTERTGELGKLRTLKSVTDGQIIISDYYPEILAEFQDTTWISWPAWGSLWSLQHIDGAIVGMRQLWRWRTCPQQALFDTCPSRQWSEKPKPNLGFWNLWRQVFVRM
jgi:hypothetical protein